MTLLRLDAFPDLPDLPPDQIRNFFSACRPGNGFFNACADAYQKSRFELIPSGRRLEHPFVTLLRNERHWYWWELSFYKSLIPKARRSKAPLPFRFPTIFNRSLQISVQWRDDLDGLLVFGPIPTEDGLYRDAIESDIDSFHEAISGLSGLWGEVDGADVPRGAISNFLSRDRLRRMFFAGGSFVDEAFGELVESTVKATDLACKTELPANLSGESFQNLALDIIETVARAAAFRQRYKHEGISIRYPRLNEARFVIQSDSLTELSLLNGDGQGHANGKASLAVVEIGGHAANEATESYRDFHARAEDQNTKYMMQQFMLTRHWLSDRFARLSSMYDDSLDPLGDASHNLVEICRWLATVFDADFTAIYHVKSSGALHELKYFARDDEWSRLRAEKNSSTMSRLAAAENVGARGTSSCYRAFWSQKAEHIPNWNGKIDSHGMASDGEPDPGRPRSTIAAPIMVFGRPWGVIELVGATPNQFDKIARMWLEEASQLIGNALYQTWLLKQITQANLVVLGETYLRDGDADEGEADEGGASAEPDETHNVIARGQVSKEMWALKVRNRICQEMAELFIADAAALWLDNEQWPGRYQLVGVSGVQYDVLERLTEQKNFAREARPEIAADDHTTVIARAMRSAGANQIFDEHIEPVEDTLSPRNMYRRALYDSGIRHVMVVPLVEQQNGQYVPIGALSLYSMSYTGDGSIKPYGPRWLPVIEFAGRHLAMLTRTLALEAGRQIGLELMLSHETIGSLTQIKDQFGYLRNNFLNDVIRGNPDEAPPRSHVPRRELDKANWRVKNGIEEALASLKEMREKGFKLPQSETYDFRSRTKWDREPVVLYNLVQNAFNSVYVLRSNRSVSWRVTGASDFIRLRYHPKDLATIFDNLAVNAIKYGNRGSEVRVNFRRAEGGNLFIEFFNEAPPLKSGEASRLFNLGFRGDRALATGTDGSGNGLFIVKKLATSLGIGLSYEKIDEPRGASTIHKFTVGIKEENIVYGR